MPAKKTTKTKPKPKPKKKPEKVIEAEVVEEKPAETRIVKVMPDSEELMNLSDTFAKSGMFPSITNKFEAAAVIEYGREIGLKPIISLQTISVIKGKLSIESKALYALALLKGINVKFVKKDAKGCTLEFSKKGRAAYTTSFTEEDAKRAGLDTKDNYMKYPEEMYFNRCISKGLRAFDPGVLLGIYTVEEMDDFSDSPLIRKEPEEAKEEQEKVTFTKTKESPTPEPEPPVEEDPKEKEDVVEILKKYMEENKIDPKLFKKYLSEELQPKKPDRVFVGLKFGHWSLTEGKLEDLKLLHKNMDLVVKQYLNSETFEKEAKKIKPDEETKEDKL